MDGRGSAIRTGTDHPEGLERIVQLYQRADGNRGQSGTAADVHAQWIRTRFQAWSEDNGETWTRPQPTSLASSTAPAQIRTLPNGHLLAVWNQETEDELNGVTIRTRVSAAISRNGAACGNFSKMWNRCTRRRGRAGPIRPVRPAEYNFDPGLPAPEREREHVSPSIFTDVGRIRRCL